jgi:hypothetical protein
MGNRSLRVANEHPPLAESGEQEDNNPEGIDLFDSLIFKNYRQSKTVKLNSL